MSELLYQDELVRLYVGDSTKETSWLDADILVTDPPYGMGYQSNWPNAGPTERILGDRDTALRDQILAMWGTDKPALVFGTWRAPRPEGVRELLVWYKGNYPGMGDLALPWGSNHEEVYLLGGRGGDAKHWHGPRTAGLIHATRTQGSAPKQGTHPTPKPIYLMQALIRKINPEYTIGDPFAGEGATLVAAKMLGRKAIGVELEAEYAAEAARRLERIK